MAILFGIFLFSLENSDLFFRLYPKLSDGGRRSPDLVTSSKGEIDAVCSLSYKDLTELQKSDKKMFIHYFCSTFNTIVKPYFERISEAFRKTWNSANLLVDRSEESRTPRTPTELPVRPNEYREYEPGKYV